MTAKPSTLEVAIAHNYFLTQLPIFKYLLHVHKSTPEKMEYKLEILL